MNCPLTSILSDPPFDLFVVAPSLLNHGADQDEEGLGIGLSPLDLFLVLDRVAISEQEQTDPASDKIRV